MLLAASTWICKSTQHNGCTVFASMQLVVIMHVYSLEQSLACAEKCYLRKGRGVVSKGDMAIIRSKLL